MVLPNINPTKTNAWDELTAHFEKVKSADMREWFHDQPGRSEEFKVCWNDFLVDYHKHRITKETKQLLLKHAEEINLKQATRAQFDGRFINETESRAVLHTALRSENKSDEVSDTLELIKNFSDEVIHGKWKGFTGDTITDVVNIGI